MGQVFGKEKPLKEIVRENQRMIKKAVSSYFSYLYTVLKLNAYQYIYLLDEGAGKGNI